MIHRSPVGFLRVLDGTRPQLSKSARALKVRCTRARGHCSISMLQEDKLWYQMALSRGQKNGLNMGMASHVAHSLRQALLLVGDRHNAGLDWDMKRPDVSQSSVVPLPRPALPPTSMVCSHPVFLHRAYTINRRSMLVCRPFHAQMELLSPFQALFTRPRTADVPQIESQEVSSLQ